MAKHDAHAKPLLNKVRCLEFAKKCQPGNSARIQARRGTRSCLYERTCSCILSKVCKIASCHSIKFNGKSDTVCSWVAYLYKDNLWQSTVAHPVTQTCGLCFLSQFAGVVVHPNWSHSHLVGPRLSPPADFIRERERETVLIRKQWLPTKDLFWTKANNYKHLASAKAKKQMESVWRPCKHCALCGYHG